MDSYGVTDQSAAVADVFHQTAQCRSFASAFDRFPEGHKALESGSEALSAEYFREVRGPGVACGIFAKQFTAGLLEVVFEVIKVEAFVGQRQVLFLDLVVDPGTSIVDAQHFVGLLQLEPRRIAFHETTDGFVISRGDRYQPS